MRMSPLQYGTMRFIITHVVTVDYARILSNVTLGSLIHHSWVERKGNILQATKLGNEACDNYTLAVPNERTHEGDLTERVQRALHMSNLRLVKQQEAKSA